MEKRFRYIIFLILILLLFSPTTVFAKIEKPEANFSELTLYSDSILIMEKNTKDVLFEKNGYKRMYPASTTKILTAIVVLEKCYLNEVVSVSPTSISRVPKDYTISGLKVGEKLRVEELLYILLIPSANDVANLLAEHTAGSIPAFADLMNKKAAEIGLKDSHFTNPSGLHDKNLYTTAYDLALLANYASNNEKLMNIVKTKNYTIPRTDIHPMEDRTFTNSNLLIQNNDPNYYYKYATGMKTGFTDPAGDCLVATAKKDGVEFIAICLKGRNLENGLRSKFVDCKTLFDFAFENYTDYYKNLQEGNNENNSIFDKASNLLSFDVENTVDVSSSNNSLRLLVKIVAVLVILIALWFLIFGKKEKKVKTKKKRTKRKWK